MIIVADKDTDFPVVPVLSGYDDFTDFVADDIQRLREFNVRFASYHWQNWIAKINMVSTGATVEIFHIQANIHEL